MVKVQYEEPQSDGSFYSIASTVSIQSPLDLAWEHGEIRGGTNAVLLKGRNEYLGFFHSMNNFDMESKKSYFFGAFTFSAEPPFRLRTLSHEPILDKISPRNNLLYDGKEKLLRWNMD